MSVWQSVMLLFLIPYSIAGEIDLSPSLVLPSPPPPSHTFLSRPPTQHMPCRPLNKFSEFWRSSTSRNNSRLQLCSENEEKEGSSSQHNASAAGYGRCSSASNSSARPPILGQLRSAPLVHSPGLASAEGGEARPGKVNSRSSIGHVLEKVGRWSLSQKECMNYVGRSCVVRPIN